MPESLERYLKAGTKTEAPSVPAIFDLSHARDEAKVRALFKKKEVRAVVDDYREQQLELFQVKNPTRVYTPEFRVEFEKYWRSLDAKVPAWKQGRWVYYPWLSMFVHLLPDAEFQVVRTARNRNLITAEEQKKFYDATIGIAGLSVGNSVATTIALTGGGKRLRLADFDRLALSNTNRVRAGVQNLGLSKVLVTARQVYEINPYAKIDVFLDGLTPENIRSFFDKAPELDIVVDEIDNLALKYLIREEAKRRRMAVVMAADNGDNAVVEVERYDLDRNQKFFHGRMGKVDYEMLKNQDKFGIGRLITKWVGAETVTDRMKDSLMEMGKTIVSWPQLGGAALLNGAAVAYCVRRILNGQSLEPDRALLSMDEKLIPGWDSPRERKRRAKRAREFEKIFGL